MPNQIVHGHAIRGKVSPEFWTWCNMMHRCHSVGYRDYPEYGGRGIKVCDRWRGPAGFAAFFADMGPRPSKRHSIDRYPDNNGNYEPGNCRWATASQQMRNTRRNRLLTFQGRTMCMTDWSNETGIPCTMIRWRLLKLKWSVERTLTTPVKPRVAVRYLEHNGETLPLQVWAKRVGIMAHTLSARIHNGWSVHAALTTPVG